MAFTREQLAKYDGIGENPAYVSYEGRVYDVTPRIEDFRLFNLPLGTDLTDREVLEEEINNLLSESIVVGGLSDG